MYAGQPTTTSYLPSPPPPSRGVFGTNIPASVAFAIGILLFLLPFAELKCTLSSDNGINLQSISKAEASLSNTGLGFAMGNKWKMNIPEMGKWLQRKQEEKFEKNINNQKPNTYAIVALVFAIIGLCFSFVKTKISASVNIATGLLSAAALVGLMLDIKKNTNNLLSEMEKSGNQFLTLSFTPWFYIAVIALLAAAIFSYIRIASGKT